MPVSVYNSHNASAHAALLDSTRPLLLQSTHPSRRSLALSAVWPSTRGLRALCATTCRCSSCRGALSSLRTTWCVLLSQWVDEGLLRHIYIFIYMCICICIYQYMFAVCLSFFDVFPCGPVWCTFHAPVLKYMLQWFERQPLFVSHRQPCWINQPPLQHACVSVSRRPYHFLSGISAGQ